MFKWLVKRLSQDDDDAQAPGSERGLQAFIEALPITQPARTLEAIGEPFENAAAQNLGPALLRRALTRLDARAQAPLAQL